jgi:hypothetical protein
MGMRLVWPRVVCPGAWLGDNTERVARVQLMPTDPVTRVELQLRQQLQRPELRERACMEQEMVVLLILQLRVQEGRRPDDTQAGTENGPDWCQSEGATTHFLFVLCSQTMQCKCAVCEAMFQMLLIVRSWRGGESLSFCSEKLVQGCAYFISGYSKPRNGEFQTKRWRTSGTFHGHYGLLLWGAEQQRTAVRDEGNLPSGVISLCRCRIARNKQRDCLDLADGTAAQSSKKSKISISKRSLVIQ